METLLNIRFIYENNNYTIAVDPNASFLNLKEKIKEELKKNSIYVDVNGISIKLGFPPKTIEGNADDSKNMKDLKISNNEQLRVEIKNSNKNFPEVVNKLPGENITSTSSNIGNKTDQIDFSKFSVLRKIIAADNSCLFNSINYAINQSISEPQLMRELIATEILSNPEIYNAAILEKDPDKYCDWIMRNDTWGGGIELSILSKLLDITLAVADIKHCKIEYIGEVKFLK
jgi:ubiquitin thioesterase OTU1